MLVTLKGTVTQIHECRCSSPRSVNSRASEKYSCTSTPHPPFFATQGVPIFFPSARGASAAAWVAPSHSAKRVEMHRCSRHPQLISSYATHSSGRKWANEAEVNAGMFSSPLNWTEHNKPSNEIFRSSATFLNTFLLSHEGYKGLPEDSPWQFALLVIWRIRNGPKRCVWMLLPQPSTSNK